MTPVEALAVVRARLERMVNWKYAMRLDFARALDVLDRHSPYSSDPDCCSWCASEDSQPVNWPCPEVTSVLRAWQP